MLKKLSEKLVDSKQGFYSTNVVENISYTENGHQLIQESEENSFWFDHRARCILKCLKIFDIQEILDLGGGNGQLALFFQQNNIESILVEPKIEGVKNAINQGVKNVVHGTLSSISVKQDSISHLGIFDVLEHIEDDKQLISNIYSSLKPGGKLIITVPAYQALYSKFDKDVGHYRRYRISKLVDMIQGCGFKVEYSSYLFSFLLLPMFVLRKIYPFIKTTEAKRSFGHTNKKSVVGKALKSLLYIEYLLVSKIKIPFGTSCLVVVSKPV